MEKTVNAVIRGCETFGRSKYARKPKEAPLEIKETKYLTVIDRFSRVAIVKPLTKKSGLAVTTALLEVFRQYGCPSRVTEDGNLTMPN